MNLVQREREYLVNVNKSFSFIYWKQLKTKTKMIECLYCINLIYIPIRNKCTF